MNLEIVNSYVVQLLGTLLLIFLAIEMLARVVINTYYGILEILITTRKHCGKIRNE